MEWTRSEFIRVTGNKKTSPLPLTHKGGIRSVHTPSFHVLFPSGLSLLSVRVYDTDAMLSVLGIGGRLRGNDV